MTETRLLDFSDARPSVATIKHAGASGVMRYVTRVSGPKRITASEAKTYRDAGLWLGLVFEDAADRAKAGYAAGVADAQLAAQQAKAIGYPAGSVIFYAVDQALQWAQVSDYFRGVRDTKTGYPGGDYGDYTIVEGAAAVGILWHWQTVAWSGGRTSVHAHLYQRNTQTIAVPGTDENVLLHPLPLWGAPAAPAPPQPAPAPKPVPLILAPTPTPQEDLMRFLTTNTAGSIFLVEGDTLATLTKRHLDPTSYHIALAANVPHQALALSDGEINSVPDAK